MVILEKLQLTDNILAVRMQEAIVWLLWISLNKEKKE